MAETIISPGVFQRENDISFIQPAPPAVGAAIIGPTVKGPVEVPTLVTSYNDFSRKFGVTFESASTSQEFLTSIAAKSYFDQGGESLLVSRVVPTASGWASAQNTHISSSAKASTQPFEIKTIGEGVIYNNATSSLHALEGTNFQNSDSSLKSGSQDNLRWEISNINNNQGTFSLTVRRGDDNLNSKIPLETFNDLSLDPNSPNYISAKIGDQYKALTSGEIITTGDYVNKSNYIYVSAVNLKTYDYLGTDGITVQSDSAGVSYSGSLPIADSGSFYNGTGNIISATNNYFSNIAANTQGLAASDYSDIITLLGNKDEAAMTPAC